jgi:hypothetical protein
MQAAPARDDFVFLDQPYRLFRSYRLTARVSLSETRRPPDHYIAPTTCVGSGYTPAGMTPSWPILFSPQQ